MTGAEVQETVTSRVRAPHHRAMIDACVTGNLKDKPEDPVTDPPVTLDLILAAVKHKQTSTLKYVLEIYPTADISYSSVIPVALEYGNVSIFEILYKHDPKIVLGEDDAHVAILVHACRSFTSDEDIIWLLDHGADPTTEQGLFGGAVGCNSESEVFGCCEEDA
ncbi:uncharacterized protein PAC_15736 [Phialocephala subalpina]|uniref:Ankyrin n=1 Tax=Phialocephala subalpina TaxID=576137 RepID=A0A1L7XLL7_9HELO|nr:uncharacterized protein PAC_15736 [Phialocephala subalpina]